MNYMSRNLQGGELQGGEKRNRQGSLEESPGKQANKSMSWIKQGQEVIRNEQAEVLTGSAAYMFCNAGGFRLQCRTICSGGK